MPAPTATATNLSALIWGVAELLRGDYKQSDYGKVILPFTLLRRLDCVLAPTKPAVLAEAVNLGRVSDSVMTDILTEQTGYLFYNTSKFDIPKLLGAPDHLRDNLTAYIRDFSKEARDIFEHYEFDKTIESLAKSNLLYLVLEKFKAIDLSPRAISNADMGLAFEELIRRFAELSNETAGEHFTPREVIRLMVNLLFAPDQQALGETGVIRSVYDPTAGTGGMLTVAEEHLRDMNPGATLNIYGQELNDESYAICKADMLIKGHDIRNIHCGNTLSADGHRDKRFDYMLSNPPFGVDWKKVQKGVTDEHTQLGHHGRFGPGLPRTSDGSLLFLLHLLAKMRPARDGGSRIGIVLNGSPLFTGDAGSGESEIRRHVLENDLLETLVALPNDMFYNTGIATYLWILSNRKRPERAGKVLLVNAAGMGRKMKKSLGSKRKELGPDEVDEITRLAEAFSDRDDRCRLLDTATFGYWSLTVERPERDARGQPVLDKKGRIKADSSKRDNETVPFTRVPKFSLSASGVPTGDPRPEPAIRADLEKYLTAEVLPHAPDAYLDHDKTRVGYEIPFNRFFYRYEPPRPLADIDRDLRTSVDKIQKLLSEITR